MNYPVTKKDTTVDDYFGNKIADPYRWLEVDTSPETKIWVDEQNKVTDNYLSQISYRDQIKERLTAIWNYPKEGAPIKVGVYYLVSKTDTLFRHVPNYFRK